MGSNPICATLDIGGSPPLSNILGSGCWRFDSSKADGQQIGIEQQGTRQPWGWCDKHVVGIRRVMAFARVESSAARSMLRFGSPKKPTTPANYLRPSCPLL